MFYREKVYFVSAFPVENCLFFFGEGAGVIGYSTADRHGSMKEKVFALCFEKRYSLLPEM